MTANDQAKILREMAAGWLQSAADAERYSLSHDDKHREIGYCQTQAAALNAGAEALEAISAKQTSANAPTAQKAETLSSLADTADALAKLDCGLINRDLIAQRAALFRECAAMMRERQTVDRDAEGGAAKNGWHLWAGPVLSGFISLVTKDGRTLHCDWHPTLEAAHDAAVAWVDGQEGK